MKRAAFCQAHGVAPQTLDYYRRVRRSKTEPTQRLVAVELVGTSGAGSWPAPSHQARLRVELRNGRQIVVEEGFSATLLKSVVAALEAWSVFSMGAATRIYVAMGATDMRKSFNGLEGLVRERLACDPTSGHIFLFANARRDRLKLIFFDGTGLWVCAKRMEGGRLRWPEGEQSKVQLSREQFALLIGGIDLSQTQQRKWYRRAVAEEPHQSRTEA
jgi:transposase